MRSGSAVRVGYLDIHPFQDPSSINDVRGFRTWKSSERVEFVPSFKFVVLWLFHLLLVVGDFLLRQVVEIAFDHCADLLLVDRKDQHLVIL